MVTAISTWTFVTPTNSAVVTDITYIKTHEGFLFLAVVMDLFARNIVGWSMSDRMPEDLAMQAIAAAYWRRKPQQQVSLHSDQGSNIPVGSSESYSMHTILKLV